MGNESLKPRVSGVFTTRDQRIKKQVPALQELIALELFGLEATTSFRLSYQKSRKYMHLLELWSHKL